MITEYSRPKSLEAAIKLLERKDPQTLPIGGGSLISQHNGKKFAVVDLQDLGLSFIRKENGKTHIGATTTLAQIENSFPAMNWQRRFKFRLDETSEILHQSQDC
jgi:CO/xanthine dehydrogenase FAD-binding subunit